MWSSGGAGSPRPTSCGRDGRPGPRDTAYAPPAATAPTAPSDSTRRRDSRGRGPAGAGDSRPLSSFRGSRLMTAQRARMTHRSRAPPRPTAPGPGLRSRHAHRKRSVTAQGDAGSGRRRDDPRVDRHRHAPPRAAPSSPTASCRTASASHAPRWRLAVPRSGRPRGLVVALHGFGGSADDAFNLGFADAVETSRMALVSVDGGDTYWHARRDGSDTGAMVREELVPMALSAAGLSHLAGHLPRLVDGRVRGPPPRRATSAGRGSAGWSPRARRCG